MRVTMVEFLDKRYTLDHLGFLPMILQSDDPRPVAEQIAERYAHGGGYHPSKDSKWKLVDRDNFHLRYPGDPVFKPAAKFIFPHTKEVAFFYPDGAWLLIVQAEGFGDYVLQRMD
ncbi:hypothetical protein [Rhizobium phage RHph_X3_2]|nr:hypothetical protein [Rhizobium phage RHph_X3_2]